MEVPEKEGGDPPDWEMKQGLVRRGNGRVQGGRTGMSLAWRQMGPKSRRIPGQMNRR